MRLVEFMTTNIQFIAGGRSVYDAIEQMVDRRIRSLVVQFADDPPEYGVITARDIVVKVLGKDKSPADVKVSEIASKPMLCVNQDVTLHEAARLMEENNVARVFVCKSGKVVGVVAMIDLMSAVLIMRARGEHVD